MTISRDFFAQDAVSVARGLIGAELCIDGVGGRIVETEAYDAGDPASHSFGGATKRNAAMFGPVGHAYVYRIYGLHWCLNFVCAQDQPGSAVLIRAVEPLSGIDVMRARRGAIADRLLCSGPGRLAQALGVDAALDGAPLDQSPFALTAPDTPSRIVAGPRIGITKAAATPWRFCLAGSRYLSKPV
ncbi:DNA-3-methyladenine glycosylase [Sphingomonas glacialis]|uniref:Putative 3-methyladenine DNA glycosylase n=1 Tax=Sphingomonas glacialis TaxID=658225 RepID=A0A502FYW3_9SPHN|nr:DNA-3-methyladenine glycosylase [Sphingomonas glacialis]TPG54093.1 DNA-3-methyladenine glycosylase [Sphingomonas glacialis]